MSADFQQYEEHGAPDITLRENFASQLVVQVRYRRRSLPMRIPAGWSEWRDADCRRPQEIAAVLGVLVATAS